MKRKVITSVIILSVLFIVSFVTIYAAFIMTHNYEANIEYHEISNATLSNSVLDSKVTFTKPGDEVTINYNLVNSDDKEYVYYYSFEPIGTSDNLYLDMIYVYQNDQYCGMLREFLFDNGLNLKKALPLNEYIFNNETRTTVFRFELHNEASTYDSNGISVNFKIKANLSTTDVRKTFFVDNDTFDNYLVDVNSSGGQTIILKEDITTSLDLINKNCLIDLCGNTLTLSNQVVVGNGVDIKIIDSRGGGEVLGEGFNLQSADSFIELEASLSKLTYTDYNKEKLIEKLNEYYQINKIINSKEDFDLFGYYSVYGLNASSNDVSINNGVISANAHNTNSVIKITVENIEYEFKYIGSNYDVINTILTEDLAHLQQFISSSNGLQVANDLFLPNSIKQYNGTISWHSSNEKILSSNGIVQENQGNIILTATIKVFDIVVIQEYYIYIIQPDNLSKLQYLIGKVEQGVTLDMDTEDTSDDIKLDVVLTQIAEEKYLPVAGDESLEYHYTKWTDGLDLDIIDIEYSIEGGYKYIDLNQTLANDIVTQASVSLNRVTYSKAARVLITATFDNGEVRTSYITLTIHLNQSSLADEIFDDIQVELNNVDVLTNMLNTRAELGVLNESGDFIIPAKVDVVDVQYESLYESLYEIETIYVKDENENNTTEIESYKVHFKDYKYLDLTESSVPILCIIPIITYDENGNELVGEITKTLSFMVPPAITSENLVSISVSNNTIIETKILDLTNQKIKRLFYSIKLQTLQQAECQYYDVSSGTLLTSLTNASDVYNLGEYILFNDIEQTTKLMFEYGRVETILDYYDLEILTEIFKWATYSPAEGEEKVITTAGDTPTISSHIDSNLLWIPNDGLTTISDGEIAVIKSYSEKYVGFNEIWDAVINPLDNELTDDEIGEMLEALAQDKTYVSLLNWITDDVNSNIPLDQWLLLIDEESEFYDAGYIEVTDDMRNNISTTKNIPIEYLSFVNDGKSNITNDEERLITYYVLVNHPDKFNAFITEWYSHINRLTSSGDVVRKITEHTPTSYVLDATNSTNNEPLQILNSCYDPVFAAILNWATASSTNDVDEDNAQSLTSALSDIGASFDITTLFDSDTYSNVINHWYKYDHKIFNYFVTSTDYGNAISLDEWGVIVKYLNYYGITSITYNGSPFSINTSEDNSIVQVLSTASDAETLPTQNNAAIIHEFSGNADGPYAPQLTLGFMNKMIEVVNSKYANVSNFNSLVDWSKDTTVELETWRDVLNNQTIAPSTNEVDNIRIKDCVGSISYDEYYVLNNYLSYLVLDTNINEALKTSIMNYYIGLDMDFQNNDLSSGYNNVLSIINDVGDFDALVEQIRDLGNVAPTEGSAIDNLETVSASEIKELIMIKPDNDKYVTTIKNAFSAYSITVTETNGEYSVSVVPVESSPYDRTLTEEDIAYIKTNLGLVLESSDEKYLHISSDQLGANEVLVFDMLMHYNNLIELSFRGTSANYLFDSNDSANAAFSVVSLGCETIEKISMNYCGISDISPISNLIDLLYINLRSNYQKDGYLGLESISDLIYLNDLKNSAGALPLNYVNVYDTNVTTARAQIVLGKLYEENNQAELYLDVFGEETKYPFEQYLDDNKLAIYALSLLYELDTITGDYILLPNKVFRNYINESGVSEIVEYDLTWKVVVANSLVRIEKNGIYNFLRTISTETGQCTISASITIGDITETRYFVIEIL